MPQHVVGQSLRMFNGIRTRKLALEKNAYSDFFGCNILEMSIKSTLSIVSFRISGALLIFYLEDLFIDVSGVLKSPIMIVFPSISPFMSVRYLL